MYETIRYEYIGKDKTGNTDNDLFNPVYMDGKDEVISSQIETYFGKKDFLASLEAQKTKTLAEIQMMIDAMNN